MKLADLLRNSGIEAPANTVPAIDVAGVVFDSRQARPGSVFVALKGNRQDGRLFVDDAVKRGACAVVSEKAGTKIGRLPAVEGRQYCSISVDDARQALARMASEYHGNPSGSLHMTGVTGTNGKTTVAYLVKSVFDSAGRKSGLIGTVEYLLGDRVIPAARTTPEAPELQSLLAQMLGVDCSCAIMEVSSHALVQQRTACIDFDLGLFLNLSRDHLDYHKSMEKYFQAKKILMTGLGRGEKNAVGIINADDSWGRRLAKSGDIDVQTLTFGLGTGAVVTAENIALSSDGSSFDIKTPWGSGRIETHLLGRYNVSNILAAAAACGAAGVEPGLIFETLSGVNLIPGRLEEIKLARDYQVFVDYAHTDDALENVLETLREITRNRLIVVFGCGGDRDRGKRPAMGRVAGNLADFVVLTSDNPRTEDPKAILAEIKSGMNGAVNYEVIEQRRDAIQKGLSLASAGDVVLIAGKGHENFQELANTTIPFDDRKVVMEILEKNDG